MAKSKEKCSKSFPRAKKSKNKSKCKSGKKEKAEYGLDKENRSSSDGSSESSDEEDRNSPKKPATFTELRLPPICTNDGQTKFRLIQLQNGFRALLISNATDNPLKRQLEQTPSQTVRNCKENPKKKLRPVTATTANKPELTIRQAIESRILVFIDESLLLVQVTAGETPVEDESALAALLQAVKLKIKGLLANYVKKVLDELLPQARPTGNSPMDLISNEEKTNALTLPEDIKNIFKTEVMKLIESSKKLTPLELILQAGQTSIINHLGNQVRAMLLEQLGKLLMNYLAYEIANGEPVINFDSKSSDKPNLKESTGTGESCVWGICGPVLVDDSDKSKAENKDKETKPDDPNEPPPNWKEFGMMNLDIRKRDTQGDVKVIIFQEAVVSLTLPTGSIMDEENQHGISDLCRKLVSNACHLQASASESIIYTTFTHLNKKAVTRLRRLKSILECVAEILDYPNICKADVDRILRSPNPDGVKLLDCYDFHNPLTVKAYLHLLYSFAKFDHPLHNISPGCLEALHKTNMKAGEVLTLVHEFWCKHYRVENATLAVQSDEPLDVIQRQVVKHFGRIKTRPGTSSIYGDQEPFDTSEFRRLVKVVPNADSAQKEQAILTWSLPPAYHSDCDGLLLDYISTLLSWRGPGSVFHKLFRRGFIHSIFASCPRTDYHRNQYVSLFQLHIELSNSGLESINEAIGEIFAYLKLMKERGPDPVTIRHLKISKSMAKESSGIPLDYEHNPQTIPISNYSHFLQANISGATTLTGIGVDGAADGLTNEAIECCIDNLLAVEDINIMLISRKFKNEGVVARRERYFGTHYFTGKIEASWISNWKDIKVSDDLEYPTLRSFPSELLNFTEVPKTVDEQPQIRYRGVVEVVRSEQYVVWHIQIPSYKKMIALVLSFSSVQPLHCALYSASLSLMIKILENELAEEFQDIRHWNGTLEIEQTSAGFIVKLCCHKYRLPHLIKTIITKLRSVGETELSPEDFQIFKQWILKDHHARMFNSSVVSENLFDVIARKFSWPITDISAELEKMQTSYDLEEFKNFVSCYLQRVFVGALVLGNISAKESCDMALHIHEVLKGGGCELRYLENSLLHWPSGDKWIQIKSFNPDESRTLISKYYQLGKLDLMSNTIAKLICELMISHMLHLENGGAGVNWIPTYEMSISIKEVQGMVYFRHDALFTANSACTTKDVDSAMDEFIVDFERKVLRSMENTKFNDFLNCKLKAFQQENDPACIQEEIKWYAQEMDMFVIGKIPFESMLAMHVCETLDLKSVRQWYHQNLLPNDDWRLNPSRLCIKILPNNDDTSKPMANRNSELVLNLTSLVFSPLSRDEEANEWTPNNLEGIHIRQISEYKKRLLVYQTDFP